MTMNFPVRAALAAVVSVAMITATLGVVAAREPSREMRAAECANDCLIRSAPSAFAGSVPILWQHGGVAYAAANSARIALLRDAGVAITIVSPTAQTLNLYALFGVRPEQDRLAEATGAILDRVEDIRLLAANELPLHVAALTAAGIQAEKVQSPCAGETAPPSLAGTLADLTAIGANGSLPAGRRYSEIGTSAATDYLYCRFSRLGYATTYDAFTDPSGHLQFNIVARAPTLQLDEKATLVVGHYDSTAAPGGPAPGADDNASGIAAMLLLAGRVAAGSFAFPVAFAALAAEEEGLWGGNAYATRLANDGTNPRAVFDLDAIGIPNDGYLFINGDTASRPIYAALTTLATGTFTTVWLSSPYHLSDDEAFRYAGFASVLITTHPYGTEPVHHTPNDVVGNLDVPQIARITDLVWQWISRQT